MSAQSGKSLIRRFSSKRMEIETVDNIHLKMFGAPNFIDVFKFTSISQFKISLRSKFLAYYSLFGRYLWRSKYHFDSKSLESFFFVCFLFFLTLDQMKTKKTLQCFIYLFICVSLSWSMWTCVNILDGKEFNNFKVHCSHQFHFCDQAFYWISFKVVTYPSKVS